MVGRFCRQRGMEHNLGELPIKLKRNILAISVLLIAVSCLAGVWSGLKIKSHTRCQNESVFSSHINDPLEGTEGTGAVLPIEKNHPTPLNDFGVR